MLAASSISVSDSWLSPSPTMLGSIELIASTSVSWASGKTRDR